MKRQNRNHRGQTNSPFEGHGLLSLSRQQREERRVGREGGCYSWLPLMWGQERVRQGGLGAGGMEVWAGNGGKEGGESCQCISIFTLQPRWLSHPVHPSAIPPSPHPSLLPESLCFQGNRLPCLPDDGAPPHPPSPQSQSPMQWLSRCRSDAGSLAARGGRRDVDGGDRKGRETEDEGRGEMSGMKGGAERAKARRDVEGVSEGDRESRRERDKD